MMYVYMHEAITVIKIMIKPFTPKGFCQTTPTQTLAGSHTCTRWTSDWVPDAVCGHAWHKAN